MTRGDGQDASLAILVTIRQIAACRAHDATFATRFQLASREHRAH